MKPSEEHLPVKVDASATVPEIGSLVYLMPRHVCPTVNNFDEAVMVAGGGDSAGSSASLRVRTRERSPRNLSQQRVKFLSGRREFADSRSDDLVGYGYIHIAHRTCDAGVAASGQLGAATGHNHREAVVLMRIGFGVFVSKK